MPRDDEREDTEPAPAQPMAPPLDEETRGERIAGGAARQPRTSADTDINSDLAAYRNRIEEKLAARREALGERSAFNLPTKVDLSADQSPADRAIEQLKTFGRSLLGAWVWFVAPAVAVCLVAAGALWWSQRIDSSPAGELSQALQLERSKSERLSRDLTAAWRQLAAQATALADRAALEQETHDLRQAMQQAEEASGELEQTLAEERQHSRQLEQQLASRRDAPAADRSAQLRETAALRQALKQAQDMAATQERSVAEERRRSDRLESELGEANQGLKAAEGRAGALAQQLAEERSRSQRLERQIADRPTVTVATDKPIANDKLVPSAVAAVADNGELSRLMQRARLLVGQGDISAARSVLERAAETGNGPALFALAETFDPDVLAAWGTLGTQGDLARARDLYARALAGGVLEAKERLATARR